MLSNADPKQCARSVWTPTIVAVGANYPESPYMKNGKGGKTVSGVTTHVCLSDRPQGHSETSRATDKVVGAS